MNDPLRVHTYNVLFGDAILVEVPVRNGKTKFILIDGGNHKRSKDNALLAAMRDIHRRTGGVIDLYILTHTHLDHVHGIRHAALQKKNKAVFTFRRVWMTASAEKGYEKKRQRQAARTFRHALARTSDLARGALALINDPDETDRGVDYIRRRSRSLGVKVLYVHRKTPLATIRKHSGFTRGELEIRVLAPELDTRVYRAGHKSGGDDKHEFTALGEHPVLAARNGRGAPARFAAAADGTPPRGVDASSFYKLVDAMDSEVMEGLHTIDAAENNTSVVIELHWRGRRLLFAGDAEGPSWSAMEDNHAVGDPRRDLKLHPVDFLKISHHGSNTGMPSDRVLQLILPMRDTPQGPRRTKERVAVVSTKGKTQDTIPDLNSLNRRIKPRVRELLRTEELANKNARFPPGTPITCSFTPLGG